jgi:ribokinase
MIRLLVVGDLNLDVHAEDPAPTTCGQETRSVVRATTGGSAGTFAAVAAELGARVTFLGAVGCDAIGDALERGLEARGIRPCLKRADAPTGIVLALHRGGDRSMICSRGANDALDADDVDPALFAKLDHLHISGYALLSETQARAARRALELAREAGASVSVCVAPASLLEPFGAETFRSALRGVDMLVLNRDEGRFLTGRDRAREIVDELARAQQAGALTLGAEGALAWRGGARDSARPTTVLDVDPTGAGDAYAAAYVVHSLRGDSLSATNRAACEAARAHLASREPGGTALPR